MSSTQKSDTPVVETKTYAFMMIRAPYMDDRHIVEVPNRDVKRLMKTQTKKAPHCIGVQFYDIKTVTVDGETFNNGVSNKSKFHFFARIFTIEEAKKAFARVLGIEERFKRWDVACYDRVFETFNGEKTGFNSTDTNVIIHDIESLDKIFPPKRGKKLKLTTAIHVL